MRWIVKYETTGRRGLVREASVTAPSRGAARQHVLKSRRESVVLDVRAER